jgi:hypothetical protein
MDGGRTERTVQRDTDHLNQRLSLLIGLDFPPYPTKAGILAHQDAKVSCGFELLVILVQCVGFSAQKNAAPSFFEEKEDNEDEDAGNNGMRPVDPSP